MQTAQRPQRRGRLHQASDIQPGPGFGQAGEGPARLNVIDDDRQDRR